MGPTSRFSDDELPEITPLLSPGIVVFYIKPHRMQDLSPEAYAEFKAAVKEYMGEEAYNTLLQKEIA